MRSVSVGTKIQIMLIKVLVFVREMAVSKVYLRRSSIGSSVAAFALVALISSADVGMAQTTPQNAVAQSVANFKANPEQLLSQYPNGGPELVSRIREIAVNDPTALDTIIALLAKATKDQKISIASGLAQAARIVVRGNQPYATRIQQAIADTKDLDVVAAYAAGAGDSAIAATGTGGAGSAGASGGQTNGLGGTGGAGGGLESINGNSVNTGNFSFASSVSGGGGTSSTNNPATNNPATSTTATVSP